MDGKKIVWIKIIIGGMRHWKKTSYPLTNQEFSVIINFQSIKTNLDSCQISSKFSFIITSARWVSVFFEDLATKSTWQNVGIPHEIERAILSCCTLFFLNGYLLSYTHVVFIMMPACRLSLHETASISRWVNAKYVYTNIYLTSSL